MACSENRKAACEAGLGKRLSGRVSEMSVEGNPGKTGVQRDLQTRIRNLVFIGNTEGSLWMVLGNK